MELKLEAFEVYNLVEVKAEAMLKDEVEESAVSDTFTATAPLDALPRNPRMEDTASAADEEEGLAKTYYYPPPTTPPTTPPPPPSYPPWL